MQIATPGDELYGNHLSQQQIDEMLAPEREVVEQISNWLKSEGLNNVKLSERNDALVVECNVSDAEKLLQTEYNSFSKTFYFTLPSDQNVSVVNYLQSTRRLATPY